MKAHCKKMRKAAAAKKRLARELRKAGTSGSNGDAWNKDDIPGEKKRGREAGLKRKKAK